MKIKYVKGDLLQAPEKYILHGCNAQGVMGSGVAKLVRAKWPSAYQVYKESEKHNGMQLGIITYAEQMCGKVIINGIIQEFYGRDGKQYVDYWAVREVIQGVDWIIEHKFYTWESSVAMPMIGAGLGGGDWDIISEIIEEESKNFEPVVYYLED